jgi:hypothetical protein
MEKIKKNQFKKYIISQNLDLKSNSYQALVELNKKVGKGDSERCQTEKRKREKKKKKEIHIVARSSIPEERVKDGGWFKGRA